ncbi:MAG: MerR family DNA-binding transcriptional regulator [bacterium]
MEKKLISIKEAAELLGVSKLTLRNWDRDGKLPALRHPISNYRVYQLEDVLKIIRQIESGEKPERAPRKVKPKVYKIKVTHLTD